ncbi:MAG: GTPase, partial [Candidatus Woesearchaeota archaeon]
MFIAMVGKPSSGKSTFFKSATLAEAEIANYPFTTIKPNHGTGYVQIPDIAKEFGKKANPREGYVIDDIRFVPVDMMDIAGLVPGAHEGLGMGSQFLDDIRQADALVHVIDISGSVNEKGEPCGLGNYDPLNDVEFLEVELDYWYKGILEKGWDRFARTVKQSKESIVKAIAKQVSAFKVTEDMVNDAVHKLKLSEEDPTTWQNSDLLHWAKELRLKT